MFQIFDEEGKPTNSRVVVINNIVFVARMEEFDAQIEDTLNLFNNRDLCFPAIGGKYRFTLFRNPESFTPLEQKAVDDVYRAVEKKVVQPLSEEFRLKVKQLPASSASETSKDAAGMALYVLLHSIYQDPDLTRFPPIVRANIARRSLAATAEGLGVLNPETMQALEKTLNSWIEADNLKLKKEEDGPEEGQETVEGEAAPEGSSIKIAKKRKSKKQAVTPEDQSSWV